MPGFENRLFRNEMERNTMCGGMEYRYVDPMTGEVKTRKAYFPIPKVKIPVISDDDETMIFCQWGKRQGEDPEFDVPITGWARLLSLKEGKWNRYNPRKVQIPVIRWMEKDTDKQSHWFDTEQNQAILGVMLEQQGEQFVYVVTRPAEGLFADFHERMPLLVPARINLIPEPSQALHIPGPLQQSLF